MRIFLLVFHVLLTLVMIGVILIQRGEDASSGSGSGGGLPGARSGRNALTRVTSILASIFFANCIYMAILVRKESKIGLTETAEKKDAVVDGSGKASSKASDASVPSKSAAKASANGTSVNGPSAPNSAGMLPSEMRQKGSVGSVKTDVVGKKSNRDQSAKAAAVGSSKKKKKGAVSKKSA